MTKSNLVLVIILSLITSSYSQNINSNKSKIDPLIGTWKMIKTSDIRTDNTEIESPPSECFTYSRFTYKSDGTLIYKRVKKDLKSGKCKEIRKDFWTGTWNRKTNGNYIVKYIFKFNEENITRSTNSTNTYTFSEDKNILKIYNDYEKSGTSFTDEIIMADYMILERVIN